MGISTMIAIIGMIVLLIVGFAAGYYFAPQPEAKEFEEDSDWRTSSINLAGSTTVLPIANASAIAFMNKYSGTIVTVAGGGSGVGYSQTIDGAVDIGMASRPPKQSEINQGVDLWLHPIALDAVCVVVNPSVASSLELTLEEVTEIFAGEYDKWSEVKPGLPEQSIYIVVREPGSGTRGTFEEYTIDEYEKTVTADAHTKPSNPEVKQTIETTDFSIGYVGFGFLSDKMVAVALAEAEGESYIYPTIESIEAGEYPISRYLYFVTSSQLASGSLADRFIDFALSTEGQQIVVNQGFLELPVTYNYP
jgi:phosphate transport system substrate-binding protein